jgi:glutamate 5-kinase
VVEARKSLFPAGVKAVVGDFDAQDAVTLVDVDGRELARALVNYGADDCRRLMGHHSKHIAAVLGYLGAETLSDRDNIVILHAGADGDAPLRGRGGTNAPSGGAGALAAGVTP